MKRSRTQEVKLTATEISEDVIALLGEGDFVYGVADVARFQQVAGVLARLAAVRETFHVMIEPVYDIGTCTHTHTI